MRVFSRLAVTIIFITGLSIAAGALDFEYKEYTIQKGDTLWDISQQELEDPFNWPIVWRENPQLHNPDMIYPGQIIRIPVNLLKQPAVVPEGKPKPAAKVEAPPPPPVKPEPVAKPLAISSRIIEITADDIMRSGYISMEVPSDGKIVGSPSHRITLGSDDEVYISRIVAKDEVPAPFNVGDKFYVLRDAGEVMHPETEEYMGQLIQVLGVAEVERIGIEDVTARITTFYSEIEQGDLLDVYYEVIPFFLTGESRKPAVEGYVVATADMRNLNAHVDVAYIDKGSRDGIERGDVVATLAEDSPDRGNGVLRVIRTEDETSTAVVVYEDYDITIGHNVTSCQKVLGCPEAD